MTEETERKARERPPGLDLFLIKCKFRHCVQNRGENGKPKPSTGISVAVVSNQAYTFEVNTALERCNKCVEDLKEAGLDRYLEAFAERYSAKCELMKIET